jgi:hypothetical protein
MPDPYEVRIPLRTEGISLPEIDFDGLEMRETSRSQREDRREGDKEFELVASFEAEPEDREEKKTEMHERAQKLAQIISFLTSRGVVAETPLKTYRADKRVQLTEESGTTVIPSGWDGFFVDLFETLEGTDEIDEEVIRALRWYAAGLVSEHYTDRFLMFWLALEIQADPQEKSPEEIDPDVENPVEQAMQAVRDEIESNYIKGRVNGFIAERIRDESIPEAVAREIRETLGEDHSSVHNGLESEMKSFQKDRSNLVHDGVPIDDVKDKAGTLESHNRLLLKRKLDPIFTGEYDSGMFPDATAVPRVEALQIILAEHPDGLTKDELRKEAFAATRDFEKAAQIVGLTAPIHDLENMGVVGEEHDGETIYKLADDGPMFECPVCGDEFETLFVLTRHLTDADAEEGDEGMEYHSGEHGEWRAGHGMAEDRWEMREVESWTHERREELMVDNTK